MSGIHEALSSISINFSNSLSPQRKKSGKRKKKLWQSVLDRVSTAVKRHHDLDNSYKGKHFIVAGLQFQRFAPLSSGQEAGQRADRHVLEKELRVLHQDPQPAEGDCMSH